MSPEASEEVELLKAMLCQGWGESTVVAVTLSDIGTCRNLGTQQSAHHKWSLQTVF